MGGRVSKDTKRRLKGKNIELILQNVWNRQNLTREYKENFSSNFFVLRLVDTRPSVGFNTRNLGFFNMRRVGLLWIFFSSMNVIVYELFFVYSQHPKWLIYDLKKCGLLRSFSPPGAKRGAPLVLEIVAERAKIISLRDIISLFSYILRVRFGSRV